MDENRALKSLVRVFSFSFAFLSRFAFLLTLFLASFSLFSLFFSWKMQGNSRETSQHKTVQLTSFSCSFSRNSETVGWDSSRCAGGGGMVLIDLGGGAAAFCAPAPLCPEYSPDPTATVGTVVASGCHSGGSLADSCALTCREGYQLTAPATPGVCTLLVDSTAAEYIGQAATCEPERLLDGSLSAAYCFVEAPEVIATCCEGAIGPCDAASNLPSECTVLCAEAWLSLWQDCEDNLGQFSGLAATCEAAAEDFMSAAPSTITVSGFRCHSYANGEYLMDDHTVGAKRAWTVRSGVNRRTCFSVTILSAGVSETMFRAASRSSKATKTCRIGSKVRGLSSAMVPPRTLHSCLTLDIPRTTASRPYG